ncbi:MAG: PKD domain-containing protein [Candidatus Hodarchaeales archaeon]|jgi:uncharacterized repeat protein (TIGR01451 family)
MKKQNVKFLLLILLLSVLLFSTDGDSTHTGITPVYGQSGSGVKSLYVNKDIRANSPISAYGILPAPTYLSWQATSSPTRYGGAGLAIDTDSEILFVTFEGSGMLDIVNATTLGILGQVTAPGAYNLAGIVVDQDEQKVYTTDRNTNKLYVYDWDAITTTLTLDSIQYLSGVWQAHGIALDEINDLLYVGDSSTTTVRMYNTTTWGLEDSFTVSQSVQGIAVDPIRELIYTGNSYPGYGSLGLLSKYDNATNTETTLDIRSLPGGVSSDNVVGLAVDLDTGFLYITTGNQGSGGSDRIIVFDSDLNMLYSTGAIGNPTGLVVPGKAITYNPLNLEKSDGLADDAIVHPGDYITYTISYENTNPTDVTGVTITDTIPENTTFVSASDSGALFGDTVTWNRGTVGTGVSDYVTVTVEVEQLESDITIINYCSIDCDQTGPAYANEATDAIANRPPVIYTTGPYIGSEGTPINFDASASSDPDGDSLDYRWDFDDDGTWDTGWSSDPTATNTWYDDHSGTVKVEVSDGIVTETAVSTVTVNNVAPVVDAGADQTVFSGDIVSFSGSFTDPGTLDTFTFEWDFGDGTKVTGTLAPSHVYLLAGTYTVTLNVTDDDGGEGIGTLTITVERILVDIDIKPGSFPNSINPDKNGVIPVAILNEGGFDPAMVDVNTVVFGPNKARPVHWAFEDVDNDGDIDLILHFKTKDTGIQSGDTSATLEADLIDGRQITGVDSVRTVPPKDK